MARSGAPLSSSIPQHPPRLPRAVAGRATAQPQPPPKAAAPQGAAAAAAAPQYPYNAGEGERKQKATIEHIFKPSRSGDDDGDDSDGGGGGGGGGGASTSGRGAAADRGAGAGAGGRRPLAPWAVGWQMSERNLVWNDDLKLRLIRRVASEQLGIPESEVDARLEQVVVLLPDLRARLAQAPADMAARLAGSTGAIAARLLRLKQAFPRADAGAMVANRLGLVLDPEEQLPDFGAAAARLAALLPGVDTDRFAEAFPAVLDVDDFERALEDAARLMPGQDIASMLRANPGMVLSLMKGKHLITYDQIDNPFS
ncbi:hypothetical protein Rsub_06177 [Raphidocelis subcapitata]|uniref:Uncharacterized protein n=1 Tax=Raphidocelis subcapitata TaxID=307507 RepID=A0A2V0P220_9CHLO|nr:hypothetical protein Rsub_06177 [Raphidocelis subcapitata]|eukprot:GBF93928.1 hypothetical protein Rsub_06177 [Raphidocelis subcapitata]